MHDKHFDLVALKQTVANLDFWLFALCYFFMTNSLNAFGYFAPTIISTLGYNGWHAQAMTVPPNVFAFFIIIGNAWWSDHRKERSLHILGGLVMIMVGYLLLAVVHPSGVRLCAIFLIACTNAAVIPFVGYRTATVAGSTSTAVATGGLIALGNLGGITAPYLFPATAGPGYTWGNWTVFGMQIGAALLVIVLWYRLGSGAMYRDAEGQGASGRSMPGVDRSAPSEEDLEARAEAEARRLGREPSELQTEKSDGPSRTGPSGRLCINITRTSIESNFYCETRLPSDATNS